MYTRSVVSFVILSLCHCISGDDHFGYGGYGGRGGDDDGGRGSSPFSDGNGGFNGISSFLGFDIRKAEAIRLAHGVIAALAFVIFFPLGAIFMRILPGRLALIMHALTQLFAYVLYIIAFGLGVWMASTIRIGGRVNFFNNYHPIIGIVIFAFLFFQPFLGVIHHLGFKKHGRRGIASHAHLLLGRTLITLGMINGGLGLKLAGNARRGTIIAYGVVAGLIWLVWMLFACFGEVRRRRNAPAKGAVTPARNVSSEEPKGPNYA